MSGTPCKVRQAAPLFGADDILGSLLGLSEAEIRRLRDSAALK